MKNKIIGLLTALAGIFILIYVSFFSTVVKDSFLKETNQKLHIAEDLQISEKDLEAVTTSMVAFVLEKQETLQVQVEMAGIERGFFNEKEIRHIQDVKNFICSLRMFVTGCCVVFLAGTFYLWKKKQIVYLAKGYFIGLVLLVAVITVIAGFTMIDITIVINGFHYLFFDNDLWIMNPVTDKVVYLFSEDMYRTAIVRVGVCLGGLLLATAIGAAVFLKKQRKLCEIHKRESKKI